MSKPKRINCTLTGVQWFTVVTAIDAYIQELIQRDEESLDYAEGQREAAVLDRAFLKLRDGDQ